jgi:hypothetical protein
MEIIIASIIRHLLTLVAGGLLTVGVSEADSHQLAEAATPVVSGAILYGVSQVWSLKDKKAR